MNKNEIAKVAHKVNKAYCESIGDMSQDTWEDCPEWQRSSSVAGVNFHINNPEASVEDVHDHWMTVKVNTGWVHGKDKDPNATPPTHPAMVKYDQLPVEQRSKDYIFKAIVNALI